MRVLLAFDKFKDSLTAPEACAITAEVLRGLHPDWTLDLCPLADGGEGFCPILTRAAGGRLETLTVTGPRGQTVEATLGFVPFDRIPAAAVQLLNLPTPRTSAPSPAASATLAVIEMASSSGLALLPPDQRDPWLTTTLGTGELMRFAATRGATALVLGVGGSATHDLGLGTLAALGLHAATATGLPVAPPIPARWSEVHGFSGSVLPGLPPIRIACDVTNPLVGPNGAAATYGPQKGLRAADLPRLDAESARVARLLCRHCGQPESLLKTPGAGAAGGISFGLMAAAGARLLPGFELVSAWLDLETKLAAADLVITGEGRFDASSLQGKGPGAVAARALSLGKKVQVFAGSATVAHPPAKLALHAITPAGTPLATALRDAPAHLARTVRAAAAVTPG
jgi:glycerate kinase